MYPAVRDGRPAPDDTRYSDSRIGGARRFTRPRDRRTEKKTRLCHASRRCRTSGPREHVLMRHSSPARGVANDAHDIISARPIGENKIPEKKKKQ